MPLLIKIKLEKGGGDEGEAEEKELWFILRDASLLSAIRIPLHSVLNMITEWEL